MKIYTKYLKITLLCFASIILCGGCSEDIMDNINKNNNYPLDTEAKFLISELQVGTAFSTVGGDLSLYSSIFMEHEVGTHNQMFNSEMRIGSPTNTTTYNNQWNSTYANIKQAKLIIQKCSPGGPEEGSNVTLGIAKVFLAYNAAILTDLFGDVPYSEAGIVDKDGLPVFFQPKVDKQEDIYKDIFKQLQEAEDLFINGKDAGAFGGVRDKDFIYGGDAKA